MRCWELNEKLAYVAFLDIPDHSRISNFRGIKGQLRNNSTPAIKTLRSSFLYLSWIVEVTSRAVCMDLLVRSCISGSIYQNVELIEIARRGSLLSSANPALRSAWLKTEGRNKPWCPVTLRMFTANRLDRLALFPKWEDTKRNLCFEPCSRELADVKSAKPKKR